MRCFKSIWRMNPKCLILVVALLAACQLREQIKPAGATKPTPKSPAAHAPLPARVPDLEHYDLRAHSQDGRYAVTVPKLEFDAQIVNSQNYLIEVKTGNILDKLAGADGWDRMNHGGCDGTWSRDGSILVWIVDGKWTTDKVVVVKMHEGAVEWAKDLSPPCRQAILTRVKAADPEGYQREKELNKGNGGAYPEGFTIDVRSPNDLPQLPMKIEIDLTSDPKGPRKGQIDAWLDATLDEGGKLKFEELHMERRPGSPMRW